MQPLIPLERFRTFAEGLDHPEGLAFDAVGNLYVTCYASDNVYKVSPRGKVQLLAYDPAGTMIARPTNAAFGGPNFDQMFFANLAGGMCARRRRA